MGEHPVLNCPPFGGCAIALLAPKSSDVGVQRRTSSGGTGRTYFRRAMIAEQELMPAILVLRCSPGLPHLGNRREALKSY